MTEFLNECKFLCNDLINFSPTYSCDLGSNIKLNNIIKKYPLLKSEISKIRKTSNYNNVCKNLIDYLYKKTTYKSFTHGENIDLKNDLSIILKNILKSNNDMESFYKDIQSIKQMYHLDEEFIILKFLFTFVDDIEKFKDETIQTFLFLFNDDIIENCIEHFSIEKKVNKEKILQYLII